MRFQYSESFEGNVISVVNAKQILNGLNTGRGWTLAAGNFTGNSNWPNLNKSRVVNQWGHGKRLWRHNCCEYIEDFTKPAIYRCFVKSQFMKLSIYKYFKKSPWALQSPLYKGSVKPHLYRGFLKPLIYTYFMKPILEQVIHKAPMYRCFAKPSAKGLHEAPYLHVLLVISRGPLYTEAS